MSYDVGSPIIGSGSATIYVLDSVGTILDVYSFTRPYNIEINFEYMLITNRYITI